MTSVNKKEIDKFSKMADEWWDPEGKFKPLHKFNPTRIKYIKENIIKNFKLKNKTKPLAGINILDIGCGGGLLSEPMSRMGANVTGIDASDKNIQINGISPSMVETKFLDNINENINETINETINQKLETIEENIGENVDTDYDYDNDSLCDV